MEDNRLERYLDDFAVPITEQEEEHFRSLSSWPFASQSADVGSGQHGNEQASSNMYAGGSATGTGDGRTRSPSERPDGQSANCAKADDDGALRSKYEIRIVAVLVVPEGSPLYSDMATRIEIVDESGGEYVEVSQSKDSADLGKVSIDPDEWPALREAIDRMIKECREEQS